MKKLLSLLLALLILAVVPAAFAETALPAVGDVVEGFRVTEVSKLALIDADMVHFVHEKTGAELVHIANNDINRVFEISFRTPATNDEGTPHVFEHSTLDGSEKYPSRSLFFNLSYQTYNTYMNAGTYNFMTTYPVGSLSEAQLLAYADFYTDSCLHPMLIHDDTIFSEEAWRYSLTDADADLTLAGTVYSEMLGAYTLDNAAYQNFMKAAYPGSTKANESGGMPAHIPGLTYEEVCDYHAAYYHPSNSLTCLYGSFEDYTAFLKLLNEYFSRYEAKEIVIEDSDFTALTESVTTTVEYPVEAGFNPANGTIAYYGILCGDLSDEDINKLDLLTTLLSDPSSSMAQTMLERFPTGSFECYIENTAPEASVVFAISGINAEDAESFKSTVDEQLALTAQNGFDPESVGAVAANTRMSTMLVSENSSLGVNLIPYIAMYWTLNDDIHGYEKSVEAMDHFVDYNENGVYQEVITRTLLGSDRSALVVTVPTPGLKEANDAALAQSLADIKAQMTPEEIDAIVAQTAALAEPDDDDAAEYVAQLQAVTIASLPEEARIYNISDTTENGVRYVIADADTNGVSRTMLLLDAGGLSTEDLLVFQLYTDLLSSLDTPAHTRAQLASLSVRYLYDSTIRVSLMDADDADGIHPYLRMAFTALDEDQNAGYELLYEMLFESDVTDVQRLMDTVSNLKTGLKKQIEASAYAMNVYRAMGSASPTTAGYYYTHYLDYYAFLCSVEEMLNTNPEAVIEMLKNIQTYFCNSNGAIVCCAGNAGSAEIGRAAADAFLAKLDNKPIEEQILSFPAPAHTEAIILNTPVQYNLLFASNEDMGLAEKDSALDAVAALVSDSYLLPMLRDQYGVYGVLHAFEDCGAYIETYRDTNIKETFDVYDALPEAIAAMEVTQEDLENYVLSTYSSLALGSGELTGAENAILLILNGNAQEDRLTDMRALKSITVESFKDYAELYAKMVANGIRSTVGGTAAITENAELYESILDPFGAANAAVPADLEEDNVYAAAALFMRQSGMMSDRSEEAFGVMEPATMGDLAAVMYTCIGGTDDVDEAMQFWAPYNLISDAAGDTFTREDLAAICGGFLQLLEVTVEGTLSEEFPDAADVSDYARQAFAFAIDSGLMLPTDDGMLAPRATATRGELALYFRGVVEE